MIVEAVILQTELNYFYKISCFLHFRRVIGGLIITASGLVIATGGDDMKLWIYDFETGNILWESDLLDYDPTSVPMTYSTGGRQYIVLNAGGHWTSPTERGDKIYAFSLPNVTETPDTTPEVTVGVTTSTTPPVSDGMILSCVPKILMIALISNIMLGNL